MMGYNALTMVWSHQFVKSDNVFVKILKYVCDSKLEFSCSGIKIDKHCFQSKIPTSCFKIGNWGFEKKKMFLGENKNMETLVAKNSNGNWFNKRSIFI